MIKTGVYTFGTNKKSFLKNKYGWIDTKMHLCGWVLSVNLARKIFDELILFCDSETKKYVIDELHLPFDKVILSCDEIPKVDESLWALPKLITYSQIDRPFIHIDVDVFLWKNVFELSGTSDSNLLSQSIEGKIVFEKCYKFGLDWIKEFNMTIPQYWNESVRKSFNFGVFGGNDYKFINEYAKESIKCLYSIDWNGLNIADSGKNVFNVIYEQYLFTLKAINEDKNVDVVLKERDDLRDSGEAKKIGFTHLFSSAKYNKIYYKQIINTVKINYPNEYKIIEKIIKPC